MWRLMRKLRPHVTLPYTIKPVIYGSLAAWLAGVPRRFALVTGLGYAFTGGRTGSIRRIVDMLYRLALGRVHKVFFQNPDDERLFRASAISSGSHPIGGGQWFRRGPRRLCVPGHGGCPHPVYLMIGRLIGDKGVREYANAARRVKAEFPDARFQLAGWIDENPDAIARSELDGWVAEGTIEFLGRLDDVRAAITEAQVYVLPSYREGTPRTVLEAMAMGRPIITTDAPGCRETVIDGDNGFLVPVKSVDTLVEAMLAFVEDPTLAPRMGKRSRDIAVDRYDVHKVNAVMLAEMGIASVAHERSGDE
ncbi:glycosyltransferase family 4 protein [Thermomonas sp.]|uniref:glycosyltransferase family 4 protein n=1 Tax=Thermomonas sp. TaxID=1971895 RepID=UPI0025EC4B94|nr:glycosyltransferase family 4 protein [Thermomonas sp.]